jgi:hypothetical protein
MKPLELALAARLPGTQVWVMDRHEQGSNDLTEPPRYGCSSTLQAAP